MEVGGRLASASAWPEHDWGVGVGPKLSGKDLSLQPQPPSPSRVPLGEGGGQGGEGALDSSLQIGGVIGVTLQKPLLGQRPNLFLRM